ncbi:MAG: carboxynorspermidine decarboxylase [Desulfovibrionaceae bacterium]
MACRGSAWSCSSEESVERAILWDEGRVPSPCFVVDEALLAANAAVLDLVQRRTGAKILLALKGFAMWSVFPILSRARGQGPLWGACASSPHEARLAREYFGGEVHAFAAAFSDSDMQDILTCADHITFNSFAQWRHFKPIITACPQVIHCGLRVNPEHSEGAVPMYDPCAPGSRLGIRAAHMVGQSLEGLTGLHFHTLCEQGADALDRTLTAFEHHFGTTLAQLNWCNMGGGHHITRPGYDIDLLCRCIDRVQQRYGVQVYLEPGEAVALNTGWLVSTVLDIIEADMPTAILDTSAAAHMPDVLEMPYRPEIIGAAAPHVKAHSYRLAGKSCLAGDVIGQYSFDTPLNIGDRCIFCDMAHYSMVKTTTFNGLGLPSIASYQPATNTLRLHRSFGYEDFKMRLS